MVPVAVVAVVVTLVPVVMAVLVAVVTAQTVLVAAVAARVVVTFRVLAAVAALGCLVKDQTALVVHGHLRKQPVAAVLVALRVQPVLKKVVTVVHTVAVAAVLDLPILMVAVPVLALSELFGPVRQVLPAHSHQQTQVTYDGIVYSS
jgi:hypothetical protein